jgi:hypothetical protein
MRAKTTSESKALDLLGDLAENWLGQINNALSDGYTEADDKLSAHKRWRIQCRLARLGFTGEEMEGVIFDVQTEESTLRQLQVSDDIGRTAWNGLSEGARVDQKQ